MNAVKIALLQLLAAQAEELAAKLRRTPQMRTEDFTRQSDKLGITLVNLTHHNALQARTERPL